MSTPEFDSFGKEVFTRDEAIQAVQQWVEYGDMSIKDMLEEFKLIVENRPSKVSESDFQNILATYAPSAPRTKVLCEVKTSDGNHICVREKHHTQKWHKDAGGFKWPKDAESRKSRIALDGKCFNGHQLRDADGKWTDNARLASDGAYKACRACQRAYSGKSYRKDRGPVTVLDEAVHKIGAEALEMLWLKFKINCKKAKLDVIETLRKVLQSVVFQVADPSTVGVETSGKPQDESDSPSKQTDPFQYPEQLKAEQVSNADF